MIDLVQNKHADVVCVSAIPPAAVTHSRYLCKRLRQRYADLKILIGLWAFKGDLKRARERIACDEQTRVTTTLAETLNELEQITQAMVTPREEREAVTR